uniref:Uncharacterized protein n=1 Tax=Arundo donax TaxID=35708 RepID=A0A0A8YZR2_ARUDO
MREEPEQFVMNHDIGEDSKYCCLLKLLFWFFACILFRL